jgi:dephospho-CoA kinase
MNKVVCIVGMCGSGKSEVSDAFVAKGYGYVRFGALTLEIIKEKGLELNEANEKKVREGLRAEHGMGAYAKLNLPKIEKLLEGGNVIADGLYSWTEYKILKEHFLDRMLVVAVLAPPKLRYDRLENRPLSADGKFRPIPRKDSKKRDYAEIENIEKGGPIAMADYYILNVSSIDELKKQIEQCFVTTA